MTSTIFLMVFIAAMVALALAIAADKPNLSGVLAGIVLTLLLAAPLVLA